MRTTLIQLGLILTWLITSAKTLFLSKVTLQVQRSGHEHMFPEETIQPTIAGNIFLHAGKRSSYCEAELIQENASKQSIFFSN